MFIGISFIHWFVIASAALSIGGSLAYIKDTLAGKTKPNRVSWFLWAVIALCGVSASLSIGADPWSSSRIFLGGLMPLIVFCVSFINPQAYWKLTTFDIICGTLAVFALILWGFNDSTRAAIVLLAVADGFAALPTFYKAWRFPETETSAAYITGLIATILVVPAIPVWNIENAAFQIYMLTAGTLLTFAVYRKRMWHSIKA